MDYKVSVFANGHCMVIFSLDGISKSSICIPSEFSQKSLSLKSMHHPPPPIIQLQGSLEGIQVYLEQTTIDAMENL